ncbi:MAG: GyrI-like domain-containing protein [Planctomycetes bacterium]|nr:GyrI-like domain-containing protein [Planctomycetota bacterium]
MPSKRSRSERVDFKKSHPELYRAARKIAEVRAARGTFLSVDGVGAPGGEAYQEAIGELFALAYSAKFTIKGAGGIDFSIPALECLWFDDPKEKPMEEWRWRLLVRIPDAVTARDLQPVRKILAERKGLDTKAVKRVAWTEGRALQILHVGPYERLCESYAALAAAAAERGLACAGLGHEVYLSDPRRAAPEKLKTIVRMPVRRAAD